MSISISISIRAKLAWTFILLLIFGITAISSYSILFIRNYLLDEGVNRIRSDSGLLSITIQNRLENESSEFFLDDVAEASGYRITIYNQEGVQIAPAPERTATAEPETLSLEIRNRISGGERIVTAETENPDLLLAYSRLNSDDGTSLYLQVSQLQDQIYAPIKTIRWIIYTGMFISIGLVIFVSMWFANYMSRPILQLESAAKRIAGGDVDETLQLKRSDEFGTLAGSLNRMALRLRSDNEKLMMTYNRQSQFFADITHELRNPLHTIAGALEMLQMEELPQIQKRHYLNTAIRQTDRINRLFRDLVVLQRYDSDTYFLEEREFDISGVLTQVYELYFPAAKSKGINLEFDTTSRTVFADPGKIEQVLDNLVSNAIKYTNEGVIEIRCFPGNSHQAEHNVDQNLRKSGRGSFAPGERPSVEGEGSSVAGGGSFAPGERPSVEGEGSSVAGRGSFAPGERPSVEGEGLLASDEDSSASEETEKTGSGQGRITHQQQEDNRYRGEVIIEVRDTGIGIPGEHVKHLFDRFYRTDKARSRDSGGTGLGLSVVKSILDAHKSEVRIKSEPGRGTSISFTLPATVS